MLEKASLIESCQGIDSTLKQSKLLHVIVDIEFLFNLFSTLSENLSEFGRLAQDRPYHSLKEQDEPVTAALCHTDSILGDVTGFLQEYLGVLALQRIDGLGFLFFRWIYLEKVSNDGQVHEPGNPYLEEKTDDKDE